MINHILGFFFFASIILLPAACQQMKYVGDVNFLNSAQANSPEFLVNINGSFCKDMDGQVGLCAKRIKSDQPVKFTLDKRPYAYRLNVTCTSSVGFSLSVDVLKDEKFSFDISPDKFGEVKSFTCTGEVFPQDRPQQVSAFWHTRFVVFDKEYRQREEVYLDNDKIIFGQHAKYTLINGSKALKEKTYTSSKDVSQAYSESELMRFNYYGY